MASTISSKKQSASRKRTPSPDTAKRLSTQSSQSRFWRDSAPKGISGDDPWKAWRQHLETRRAPERMNRLFSGSTSPLLWGVSQEELLQETLPFLSSLDTLGSLGGRSQELESALEASLAKWLKECPAADPGVDFALQSLAVAHALPRLARCVSSGLWWQLLDSLWLVIETSDNWRSDAELPPEQGWAQQLLVGELPLTLAYLFPEIRPLYQLRSRAAEGLTEGLVELLNGEGLPAGPYLSVLRPLTACWTRCRAMGEKSKKGCWKRKAEEQYKWLVTQMIRLTAPDGSALLCAPHDQCWEPEFLETLLRLGGDRSDTAALCDFAKKKITQSLSPSKNSKKVALPEPSDHCDWASVAIMRTDWDRNAATVAVDYSKPDMKIEIVAGSQRIAAGSWDWQTTLDDQPLEPEGSWEEVCWFSDEDVDFLELVIDLQGGARLERQIVLARNEMFLLLVDYVLETEGGSLCHRQSWSLDSQMVVHPEKETREALLQAAKKPVARAMPLGLPEWRADPRGGSLVCEEGQLVLEQKGEGRNLACPLLLDLQKNRLTKQCTWRQLTVAESLEIQPPEVAVAYRAQSNKQQWLIYRSLAAKSNRTFMGQNVSSESFVAKFLTPSGEVEELLEVEG